MTRHARIWSAGVGAGFLGGDYLGLSLGVAALSVYYRYRMYQQERKFMSCSHCQELGQLADLTSVWLFSQSGAS